MASKHKAWLLWLLKHTFESIDNYSSHPIAPIMILKLVLTEYL